MERRPHRWVDAIPLLIPRLETPESAGNQSARSENGHPLPRAESTRSSSAERIAAQPADYPSRAHAGEKAPGHPTQDTASVHRHSSAYVERFERIDRDGNERTAATRLDHERVTMERHERCLLWYLIAGSKHPHAIARSCIRSRYLCAAAAWRDNQSG